MSTSGKQVWDTYKSLTAPGATDEQLAQAEAMVPGMVRSIRRAGRAARDYNDGLGGRNPRWAALASWHHSRRWHFDFSDKAPTVLDIWVPLSALDHFEQD